MAGKKVNRLIVPNIYSVNGVEPVTSVNGILPVNGDVTVPIPTVPTNVSAFTNDAGYLTSATLDGYATQAWVRQQGYLTSIPSQYVTDTELSTTLANYITSSNLNTILNSYATATDLSTEVSDRRDADDSLQSQINDKYDASNPSGFISGISGTDVIAALGYTPYNNTNPNGYVTSTDLSTTLADYAQITDIPTVGNGTITINQGGVQKGTFTVNQSGNSTINLDAVGSVNSVNGQTGAVVLTASDVGALSDSTTIPTKTSDLTNDSGFITNSELTPYALSSSLATVATSGSYNDLADKPYIPSGVVVDQTYDGTSANAQSGVAIEGELSTNYQSKLVSGTNIKTVNSTSLLGSGNIDTSEIFIATYSTTSYVKVLSAYNSGKTIFVNMYGAIGSLFSYDSTHFRFLICQTYSEGMGFGEVTLSTAGWDTGTIRIFADTDLSNLSATGKTVIDGQWVDANEAIISSNTSLSGSTALTKRITLPDDGHTYEVLIRGSIYTSSTSGKEVFLTVKGNEDSYDRYIARCVTRTNSSMLASGTTIVTASYVASNQTNLTIARASSWSGNCSELTVVAYRRIGTNT